jgi:hypothetical protein
MELTLIDKSSYLKGLLIVAKKDKQLTEPEKNIIRDIAVKLGFATDFYEDTLRSLLANKYILENPVKFSQRKIAESFIIDGMKLAFADNMVSDVEIDWLKLTALENGIEESWFEGKLKKYNESSAFLHNSEFALFSII